MDQCQASRDRYVIRLRKDECPLVAYAKRHVYKELSPWLCDTLWLWMRCMKIYADTWYILCCTDMQRTETHGTRENDKNGETLQTNWTVIWDDLTKMDDTNWRPQTNANSLKIMTNNTGHNISILYLQKKVKQQIDRPPGVLKQRVLLDNIQSRPWTSMNQQIRRSPRQKTPSHLFPDQLHRDIRIGAHICSCLLDQNAFKRIHTQVWNDLTTGETTQDPKCRNYPLSCGHMQNCLYTAHCDNVDKYMVYHYCIKSNHTNIVLQAQHHPLVCSIYHLFCVLQHEHLLLRRSFSDHDVYPVICWCWSSNDIWCNVYICKYKYMLHTNCKVTACTAIACNYWHTCSKSIQIERM